MQIHEVRERKKRYQNLLLLADEQEELIDQYLDRGTMYVLEDDDVYAECVVTDEGDGVLELQNLAVTPGCHRRGYGTQLIRFLEKNTPAVTASCGWARGIAQRRSHFIGPVVFILTSALQIIF